MLPVSATVPDSGNFRYTYGLVLTSDSTLKTGDYFTIYDFPKDGPWFGGYARRLVGGQHCQFGQILLVGGAWR